MPAGPDKAPAQIDLSEVADRLLAIRDLSFRMNVEFGCFLTLEADGGLHVVGETEDGQSDSVLFLDPRSIGLAAGEHVISDVHTHPPHDALPSPATSWQDVGCLVGNVECDEARIAIVLSGHRNHLLLPTEACRTAQRAKEFDRDDVEQYMLDWLDCASENGFSEEVEQRMGLQAAAEKFGLANYESPQQDNFVFSKVPGSSSHGDIPIPTQVRGGMLDREIIAAALTPGRSPHRYCTPLERAVLVVMQRNLDLALETKRADRLGARDILPWTVATADATRACIAQELDCPEDADQPKIVGEAPGEIFAWEVYQRLAGDPGARSHRTPGPGTAGLSPDAAAEDAPRAKRMRALADQAEVAVKTPSGPSISRPMP